MLLLCLCHTLLNLSHRGLDSSQLLLQLLPLALQLLHAAQGRNTRQAINAELHLTWDQQPPEALHAQFLPERLSDAHRNTHLQLPDACCII